MQCQKWSYAAKKWLKCWSEMTEVLLSATWFLVVTILLWYNAAVSDSLGCTSNTVDGCKECATNVTQLYLLTPQVPQNKILTPEQLLLSVLSEREACMLCRVLTLGQVNSEFKSPSSHAAFVLQHVSKACTCGLSKHECVAWTGTGRGAMRILVMHKTQVHNCIHCVCMPNSQTQTELQSPSKLSLRLPSKLHVTI